MSTYATTFNKIADQYHRVSKNNKEPKRPPVRDIVPFPSKHLEGLDIYIQSEVQISIKTT